MAQKTNPNQATGGVDAKGTEYFFRRLVICSHEEAKDDFVHLFNAIVDPYLQLRSVQQ